MTFRDIYVQALAEFQAVDESDELSYFRIMGELIRRSDGMSSTRLVFQDEICTDCDDRSTWPAVSAL